MDNKKVSVIMPAYNAEKFLDASIASVRNQNYQNWELWVVDDGSADRSVEIVRSHMEQEPRIRLLCNRHGGAACARNTAMDLAEGDYFAFLDADDVYHPQYLSLMVETAEKENADLVVCGFVEGNDFLTFLESDITKDYCVITTDQACQQMYCGGWALMISPCNKLYARRLFETLRFPAGRCFEDLATVNLAVYDANRVCILGQSLYFYHITPNSSSKTKRCAELMDREWVLRSHWEFFLQQNRKDLAWLAIQFYLVQLIVIDRRIRESDEPGKSEEIRTRFETVYRKYRRHIRFTQQEKSQILAYRNPRMYDIRNMIRQDGVLRTIKGFAVRKLSGK